MKDFILHTLLKNHTISSNDLKLVYFTNKPEEALACIGKYTKKQVED